MKMIFKTTGSGLFIKLCWYFTPWKMISNDNYNVFIISGTKFMVRLQEQLKYFVVNKVSSDKLWQGPKIYLSGHQVSIWRLNKLIHYAHHLRLNKSYHILIEVPTLQPAIVYVKGNARLRVSSAHLRASLRIKLCFSNPTFRWSFHDLSSKDTSACFSNFTRVCHCIINFSSPWFD